MYVFPQNRVKDLANNISLDSVIEDGGKPSSTGTSTATSETATATSDEGEATSTASGTSEQANSASQSHVGYWAFSSVIMAFILF